MCHQSFIELLTLVWKIFEKIAIVLLFCSLVNLKITQKLLFKSFLRANKKVIKNYHYSIKKNLDYFSIIWGKQ